MVCAEIGSTVGAFDSLGDDLKAEGGVGPLVTAAAAISAAGVAKLLGSCCLSASDGVVGLCLFAPGPIGAGLGG